jgi:hypothetical protein
VGISQNENKEGSIGVRGGVYSSNHNGMSKVRDVKSIAAGLYMGIAAIGLSATSAQAFLIDNGDTTIDTLSGLEWLDLPLTTNRSYNNIVVDGFGGYANDGWVHATRSQLCGLMGALGDTLANCDAGGFSTDDPLATTSSTRLVDLLGANFQSTLFKSSLGIFDSGLITTQSKIGIGCIESALRTCTETDPQGLSSRAQTISVFTSIALPVGGVGNFLVRPTRIPEPNYSLLFGLGILGAIALRRRTRRV